jgi:RNA polymerase sigma-70 factor, ECF subfamily
MTEPAVRRIPPVTLSDEEIVARVRSGEPEQFELIMRRHNSRVYRAARSIVHDASEAEDVMQDAYVRAYEHLGEFEGRARFSTWLTRIAVHEALARVRRGKRFDPLETHAEHPSMSTPSRSSPEQETSDMEMRHAIEAAVAKLSDEYRSVFVLRAVEGMSGAEVAECLDIPEDTVKTRLHRARNQLQEMLISSIEPSLPSVYEFHLTRCDRVVGAVLRRILAR